MIKLVMATIMLIVAVSRGLAMPKYLTTLGLMDMSQDTVNMLSTASFLSMCLGLLIGAVIILAAMIKARIAEAREAQATAGTAEAPAEL